MEPRTLSPFLYNALQKFVHGDYLALRRILMPAYEPYAALPALELGCGTGTLARLFPSDKYVGVDLDAARIEAARAKDPDYEFVVGDASSLEPAFLQRFGFVFCHAWMHHIDDASVRRILGSIAATSKRLEHELNLLVMEPLLPDHPLENPVGFALGKLDRGKYVRTRAAMEGLFGDALVKTEVTPINWLWPINGATFHLRYA